MVEHVYLNQEDMPLKIICNSQKMHALVKVVLDRIKCDYEEGMGTTMEQ